MWWLSGHFQWNQERPKCVGEKGTLDLRTLRFCSLRRERWKWWKLSGMKPTSWVAFVRFLACFPPSLYCSVVCSQIQRAIIWSNTPTVCLKGKANECRTSFDLGVISFAISINPVLNCIHSFWVGAAAEERYGWGMTRPWWGNGAAMNRTRAYSHRDQAGGLDSWREKREPGGWWWCWCLLCLNCFVN